MNKNNWMIFFVLYTTCQTNKRLSDWTFYILIKMKKKNVTFGICFQLLQIPKQINKTLIFYLDRSLNTKQSNDLFCLI